MPLKLGSDTLTNLCLNKGVVTVDEGIAPPAADAERLVIVLGILRRISIAPSDTAATFRPTWQDIRPGLCSGDDWYLY